MIDVREERSPGISILKIQGPLRVPVGAELRRSVHTLLRRGGRRILLDLSRVSAADAGGIGELIHVYNMTIAARGVLRIVAATARVRELLDRAGVFDLLSGDVRPWSVPPHLGDRVA
jgi:anti-anti-sigma factor